MSEAAVARFGDIHTSPMSFFIFAVTESATLFNMFAVLCTQHR